jgi:hypothetical protein
LSTHEMAQALKVCELACIRAARLFVVTQGIGEE